MKKMSRLFLVLSLVCSILFATGAAAWAAPTSPAYQYLLRHPNLYRYLRNNPRVARQVLGDQWQEYMNGGGHQQVLNGSGYQGYPGWGGLPGSQGGYGSGGSGDNLGPGQGLYPSDEGQSGYQGNHTQDENSDLSQLEQLMGGNGSEDETPAMNTPEGFSDVPSWAQQAVGEMTARGIIKGLGNGMFGSNQTLTRAQFAALLVREFGLLSTSGSVYGTATFSDVPPTFWAYKYIEAAAPYMTYWNTGGQATFHPTDPADREDCMVAMVEAAGLANESVDASSVLSRFADASSISPNLVNLVAIAVQSGLITGSQGKDGNWYLYPQAELTRAQGAVLLYRALSYSKVAPGGTTLPPVIQPPAVANPPVDQNVYGG